MIMHWTCSALNGGMRVEVEVIFKWVRDVPLHQGPRVRVALLIAGTRLGKEPDMVTFGSNYNNKLALNIC